MSTATPSATVACGSLPSPAAGSCSSNAVGYKCEAVNGTPSWPFASVVHNYSTAGTYRAKAIIERSTANPAEGSANINLVSALPSVSNTTVSVNNSNYCTAGPHASITWTYTSPGSPPNSNQAAYEAIINGGGDIDVVPNADVTGLNPSNINPEWRISGTTGTSSGPSSGCNSGNGDANPQTTCQMTWNTAYTAWVRVRNGYGQWSSWTRMGTYVNGTNPPVSVNRWTTPVHAFPATSFTISPANPSVDSPVTFTDTTVFQGGANPRTWLWNFNYPAGPTRPINNPPTASGNTVYTYTAVGTYYPRLTATDDLGQSCYYDLTPPLYLQDPIPQWKEVPPR
ncbi:MAG: PKD domain-containing protein [Candidatus Yanofskybacteria bacterium]|nr:PKD domain-containing protein [Candidatus Yanofskybacteria bacterium]